MSTINLLALLLTLFVAIQVPIYLKNYGLGNFLWLSDIGLFLTVIALWLNSQLIMSTAMGLFPVEMVWVVDYFYRIIIRRPLLHVTDYMFDHKYSLFLRIISLFHLVIPAIWVGYCYTYGYDSNAIWYQCVLIWIILPLCYFFTNPDDNVNWVFVPRVNQWHWIPAYVWLIILMIGFPLLIFFPFDQLYKLIF